MSRSAIVFAIILVNTMSACVPDPSGGDPEDHPRTAVQGGIKLPKQRPSETLQERVDDVLAAIPGGRQVSATELSYDGLTVTFDPSYSAENTTLAPQDIICSPKFFCIIVGGATYSFSACDRYIPLSDWLGNAPFKNNQTIGTVARFYDVNFNLAWLNEAYNDGYVDVTPFWWFKACSSPSPRGD